MKIEVSVVGMGVVLAGVIALTPCALRAQSCPGPCSDGLFCNGVEMCQAGTCVDGLYPCSFADICDEDLDLCHTEICPPGPVDGCRTALKSLLVIKNKADNGADKLIWKFKGATSTSQADFAYPLLSADYALCLYAGTAEALVVEITLPPSDHWSVLGTKGYKYLDLTLADGSTQKVILKGGLAGKAKALLKGRGHDLPDPLDAGALPLPVIAQLFNYEKGICWETEFASAIKNSDTLFKAKQ